MHLLILKSLRFLFGLFLLGAAADRLAAAGRLPLVVGKPVPEARQFVFHVSGDGGTGGFDTQLFREYDANHLPYVALNSFRYFWSRKTPQQLADDVIPLLRQYLDAWQKEEIVLAGFSFGAEVLPFLYNRLPDDLRGRVRLIVMVAPARTSDFTIHLADLAGLATQHPYALLPEITKTGTVPLLYVRGVEEESIFTAEPPPNVMVELVKGGHYLSDGKAVGDLLIRELKKPAGR